MKPPVLNTGAEDEEEPTEVSTHELDTPPNTSFATEISYHDVTQETNPSQTQYSAEALRLPEPFGRYHVVKTLGQGAMGAVFLARDSSLNRHVALKIPFLTRPQPELVRGRFLREAQAIAALQHPNICPIYDIGEIAGIPYICMQFVDGQPLSLKLEWAYDIDRALGIVRSAAHALHEAHEKGIIHRDVKSANIMIDRRNEPIVMDFGLARQDGTMGSPMTVEGDLMGTPAYMSPEQFKGNLSDITPACDVYSLGVVLYECLTGKVPFRGNVYSILWQITNSLPAAPSQHRTGLGRRLDEICLKAIAKNPRDRYASMLAFAEALESTLRSRKEPEVAQPSLGRLTLFIEGTVYRWPPKQISITLGRKRRQPGEPASEGNDIVFRVPNDKMACVRISRKHGEIRRNRDCYVYIDYSKTGTTHNGKKLVRDEPVKLNSGDKLVIAGLITMIVKLDTATLPSEDSGGDEPANSSGFFEADIGNNVTVEWSTDDDDEEDTEKDV